MNKLRETLEEALAQNEKEKVRWNTYKSEHEQLIKNINEFHKHLTLDIMVPIGTKALMPGTLYHTSECLVSHSPGVFSKCTVYQVKTLCNHRLKKANEHLEKLEIESEMFQNKLDVPNLENAFAGNENEHDIIEEYDEETERKWREEHKLKVKKHKQQEAEQRKLQAQNNTFDKEDSNIFEMLEQLELMEELEGELQDIDVENEEQFSKILSGEIKLPQEKKRITNVKTITVSEETETKKKEERKEIITQTPPSTSLPLITNSAVSESAPSFTQSTAGNPGAINYNSYFHHYVDLVESTKFFQRSKKLEVFKKKLRELLEIRDFKTKNVDLQQMIDHLRVEIESLENQVVKLPPLEPKIKFAEELNSYSDVVESPPKTLHLEIVHTPANETEDLKKYDIEQDVIRSPSDIYIKFANYFPPKVEKPLKSILKKVKSSSEVPLKEEEQPSPPAVSKSKKSTRIVRKSTNIIGEIMEHDKTQIIEERKTEPKRISKFRANRTMS